MRRWKAVALLIVLAAGALALTPPVREQVHWWAAGSKDTLEGYRSFYRSWPDGRHAVEARERWDDRGWQAAEGRAAVAAPRAAIEQLQGYLEQHPQGRHAADARAGIEEQNWRAAAAADTVVSYFEYLGAYPDGRFQPRAEERIAALRADDGLFAAARAEGTRTALERFLEVYPGHARAAEVAPLLKDMDGRDIVDLVNEHKIEVRGSGSGSISQVFVEVRRLVDYEVRVQIPVGTTFVPAGEGVQTMVATNGRSVVLADAEWRSVDVPVACADLPLDVPGDDDRMTIRRSPQQAELQRLMPVLAEAGVDFDVTQAAVWIVSDDADFDTLGTLVRSSSFSVFGGERAIDEIDAVAALRLLDMAGIDITESSIWVFDAESLLEELPDGEEKSWLRRKLGGAQGGGV